MRAWLAALLAAGGLPPRDRAAAGRMLAQLGDDRPGVGVDPQTGLPDIAWGKEVPAGTYRIGDNEGDSGEKPRPAPIENPYCLSRYPITNAQFQCFVDAPDEDRNNPTWWRGIPDKEKKFSDPRFPYANHPRENVSWYQAIAFCRWLSDKLGQEIRLPHEYEWEVAARWDGGDTDGRSYPWGGDFDKEKANTDEGGIGMTTAVGLYPAGKNEALNLYDLSGNVWEWCMNKYNDPDDDKVDDSGNGRVLRGGSWAGPHNYARAAYRYDLNPDSRSHYSGFRVAAARRSPSQ